LQISAGVVCGSETAITTIEGLLTAYEIFEGDFGAERADFMVGDRVYFKAEVDSISDIASVFVGSVSIDTPTGKFSKNRETLKIDGLYTVTEFNTTFISETEIEFDFVLDSSFLGNIPTDGSVPATVTAILQLTFVNTDSRRSIREKKVKSILNLKNKVRKMNP
jgi:hypothetical protein